MILINFQKLIYSLMESLRWYFFKIVNSFLQKAPRLMLEQVLSTLILAFVIEYYPCFIGATVDID